MRRIKTYLVIFAMSFLALPPLHAQPKSIGASFSFTGLSIDYEHNTGSSDAFWGISVKSEMAERFLGRQEFAGISASFVWNIVFKQWQSSEGNGIRLFAGPGAVVGYVADFKKDHGIFMGMKGRVGIECSYSRKAIVSLCLNPIIGSHIELGEDYVSMKYYRNGIQYSLVPEIGVKYRF